MVIDSIKPFVVINGKKSDYDCECNIPGGVRAGRRFFAFQIALRGSAQTTHKYRRFVKMFFVLLVLFVVCRGPWHLIDIVLDQLQRKYGWVPSDNELLKQLALLLLVSNSWLMPVVYSLFNARIRGCLVDSMRRLLRVFKRKCDFTAGCCRQPTGTVESVSTPAGTAPVAEVVITQASGQPVESVFVSVDQERFSTVLANIQHCPER